MRTRLALLASLSAFAPLWAQDATIPAAVAPTEPVAAPAQVVSSVQVDHSTKPKDTLSVDFPDEEIRTILRNVADLFELNLVVPDTLQGRTSLKLREVTWRQIFQVVLSPIGYTFIEDGNIIKIVSQDSLAAEPVSTEIFLINYARADEILKVITTLVDSAAGGKIIIDARSNALVVTERPSRMGRIRPIIEKLDKATAQVMIESKFIDVTDGDIKNIGVNWGAALGGEKGITAGPFTRTNSKQSDRGSTTTLTAGNTQVDFLQQQQAAAGQVVGSGGPLRPAPTNQAQLDTGVAKTPIYDGFGGASKVTDTISDTISRTSTSVFSADQYKILLSAIKTQTKAKVVSNPTLVTLNNVEASINIGEQFPVPQYTYNQQTGAYAVSGFDYKPLGVLLKVTPQVNDQGFIKLILKPELSSRGRDNVFQGANIPSIVTKKTETQVSLKDGYTMGIGGLMEDSTNKGETKVPILGDIPLLGRLFKSNTSTKTTNNLLIFITARTIAADGAPVGDVFDPRMTRSMGLRKDELPGFRDGSDSFVPDNVPDEKSKKSFFRLKGDDKK